MKFKKSKAARGAINRLKASGKSKTLIQPATKGRGKDDNDNLDSNWTESMVETDDPGVPEPKPLDTSLPNTATREVSDMDENAREDKSGGRSSDEDDVKN